MRAASEQFFVRGHKWINREKIEIGHKDGYRKRWALNSPMGNVDPIPIINETGQKFYISLG